MADDVLNMLRGRLAEAEGDAQRLREAIRVLERADFGADGQTQRPASTRRRSSRPKPERATKRDPVPAGKLVKAISETDGLTTSALAKQLAGDQRQILAVLKELEAKGEIKRQGQRRATRWHLVTDEDRIAVRVKELEAAAA